MPKRVISDSISEDENESSSSEEAEAVTHGHPQGVTEYEKQRLSRIAENRARLEALGLPKMASSLKRSGYNVSSKKGKKKAGDDEEYVPDDAEARLSSSDGEDGLDDDDDDDDGDFVSKKDSRSRKRKAKKSSKPKARVSREDPCSNSYHIDDDDESLKKAIALSLQDSAEGSCFSEKHVVNATHVDSKGKDHIEDKGRRKNKKSFTSRLQMTEDEVILHFFDIDETGKGSVTMRDLRRVAASHDFVWTDKELSDMIRCFDSDNDGKLTLDDFRKIIVRCNMIKGSENS